MNLYTSHFLFQYNMHKPHISNNFEWNEAEKHTMLDSEMYMYMYAPALIMFIYILWIEKYFLIFFLTIITLFFHYIFVWQWNVCSHTGIIHILGRSINQPKKTINSMHALALVL